MRERYDAILCDLFGTLVDGHGAPLGGAQQFVERLLPARWAIVTSCSRSLADRLLRRARLPAPPVLVSADDVSRMKPSPDGYLRAAELLDVPAQHCLVVEDSSSGIRAARAAGMGVIAISHTGKAHSPADKTIANLTKIQLEVNEKREIALLTVGE